MTAQVLATQPPIRSWPRWMFDLLLWILFLGPLASPLFRATGLPLVSDTGALARDVLATFICPTPERSFFLFGWPMAVCARCWGATIGLWWARLSVGERAPSLLVWYRTLVWPWRLVLAALPFLLWPLEIIGHYSGWWFAPLWLLLLNGMQAGFAAGLFFASVWPGFWPQPHAMRV
ncbi:MAG: hypothetical protein C0184_05900 [Chloroflexus aggregans]|uniref:DUF2085 domain-containing protein n=1 Tax=Chloroflexus aggregans TaxID=152260 RepID=A0A2J6X7J9_9CHLR|nr:MAG: hypothetical protein C0184_05900 [Chloroflexus aggregans]